MEVEIVLNLLDSYWYDFDFFNRSEPTKINKIPEIPTSNNSANNLPTLPTIHTKSSTLEKMSSKSKLSDSSESPNSVLLPPKLKTIFSGEKTKDFNDSNSDKSGQEQEITTTPKVNDVNSRKILKKKGLSKSLSDLEYEELKGFMDLGFVFSEEDKDSTLVSIIPGLQRLRNTNNHENDITNVVSVIIDDKNASNLGAVNKSTVSRPYLSEVWEVSEKKKKKKKKKQNYVLNWKVPACTNQMDMKNYLRFWAHTVAFTVK